ncbi:four helix bundle protein [Curvibacter lanceolatus]|uniref:four helix bundle protein n=1 Tax=Curvibacter lanceolatus TaxID=86182 RepID=UPI0003609BE1|nr:four helix bundle protein [Curvibacter lanceolatus]
MSLHTDLPIYRTGVQLLSLAFKAQEQMPRGIKRSLGEKVSQHCVEMLDLMALANATKHGERAAHIRALMTHLRAITVLLRVSHDSRYISHKLWAESVSLLGSIGKQGGGWLKSASNRSPAA